MCRNPCLQTLGSLSDRYRPRLPSFPRFAQFPGPAPTYLNQSRVGTPGHRQPFKGPSGPLGATWCRCRPRSQGQREGKIFCIYHGSKTLRRDSLRHSARQGGGRKVRSPESSAALGTPRSRKDKGGEENGASVEARVRGGTGRPESASKHGTLEVLLRAILLSCRRCFCKSPRVRKFKLAHPKNKQTNKTC